RRRAVPRRRDVRRPPEPLRERHLLLLVRAAGGLGPGRPAPPPPPLPPLSPPPPPRLPRPAPPATPGTRFCRQTARRARPPTPATPGRAHRRGARRGGHRRRADGCSAPSPRRARKGGAMSVRLRRSELATPASSQKMIEKAARSEADLVFLDLEDAVAPPQKEA